MRITLLVIIFSTLILLGIDAPYQHEPIFSGVNTSAVYNDSGAGNIFQSQSWVENKGTRPAVAVFGEGIASGSGAQAWGGNFVAYATASGASAHGVEVNFGSLAQGGNAYGVVIASAGTYPTNAYVQMQSNTAEARPASGIVFNGWANLIQPTGTLIKVIGQPQMQNGIDLSSAQISDAALLLGGAQDIKRNGVGVYQRLAELESRVKRLER